MLLSLEMREHKYMQEQVRADKASRITERLSKDEAKDHALAFVKEGRTLRKESKVFRKAFLKNECKADLPFTYYWNQNK